MSRDVEIQAVILAGGSGSRLWPLSRQQLPKQFLSLDGGACLLDATVQRLQPLIERDDVWVMTGRCLANGEAFDSLQGYRQILEPVGRNTAPAIAIAAAVLQDESGGDPVLVVPPAGHIITDAEAFRRRPPMAIGAAGGGGLTGL